MSLFDNIITDEFKQIHADQITEVVRACSRPCRLIYGQTKFDDCPNCIYDPIGRKSSNRYQAGGPMPFGIGICPMCHGIGRIPDETTVDINLCPIWDHRSWIPQIAQQVHTPLGFVMTMSLVNTYDELKEAKEVVIDTDVEQYSRNLYVRHSEPEICGFGRADFIFVLWKRTGS